MSDLISRQDTLNAINTRDKFGVDERNRVVRWYEGLEPYVHLRDVITAICGMPTIEPEQKTGKWIRYKIEHGKCQFCGHYVDLMTPENCNYCSNCGAKMEAEDE